MSKMNKYFKILVEIPLLGRGLLMLYRAKIGLASVKQPFLYLLKWLVRSKETTNFTYDLDNKNKMYLASLISDITNKEYSLIVKYINEVEDDVVLRAHISNKTISSKFFFMADKKVRYGRRVGWYAMVRALKPKTIIETGVDKGLGACVLTAALMRNHLEGDEGQYYGTDINPKAGYLLADDYAKYGRLLYGDSIKSLIDFDGKIDLFINDSEHSDEYEAEEYSVISDKLSANAVILGDNSHCSDKLLEFSLDKNRSFVFFQENPVEHWYPGAGIGISFIRE
jgi:hypothetical protein